MSEEKAWPYAPEQDSWYRTHASIRLDMEDFLRALGALAWRTAGGNKVRDWEKANIALWWRRFVKTIKAHHDHEEGFLFPWLETRIDFTEKMSDDHTLMMQQLKKCDFGINGLTRATVLAEDLKLVNGIKKDFKIFQHTALAHFQEEESVCVPLMRKHFSHKEATQVVSSTLNRTMSAEDYAEVLRPMNKQERMDFLEQQKIPGLKAYFVMLPACKRYDRVYTAALEEVILGKQMKTKLGVGVLGDGLRKLLSSNSSSKKHLEDTASMLHSLTEGKSGSSTPLFPESESGTTSPLFPPSEMGSQRNGSATPMTPKSELFQSSERRILTLSDLAGQNGLPHQTISLPASEGGDFDASLVPIGTPLDAEAAAYMNAAAINRAL